jgi:1,4-alpha-glucan branching enzyme
VATDAGVNLQIQTGVASHRRRFGAWEGGFWLPECGHTPWLDPLLEEAGVRGACVELTSRLGLGDPRHLTPVRSDDGPVLWPIDRQTISLVWSDQGYPAGPVYRDRHRPTTHLHHAWRNDGAPYDHRAAQDQARADARDFVARVRERVAGGGVCVCALDTELLGHWWHEGIWWLAAVIEEAGDQDLPLTGLDDALARHPPEPAPLDLAVTTWGEGEDLRTWSGPAVAELAWAARTAELEALAAGRGVGAVAAGRGVGPRAVRELLALQSSDWAFLASRGTAGDYPIERARAHRHNFERALAGDPELQPELRGLAPDLVT